MKRSAKEVAIMDRLPGHWNVEASSLQSSGLAASRAHRFGTNDMSYYGNDANKVGSKVHVNQRHHYPDDAVLKATLFKSLEGVKPECKIGATYSFLSLLLYSLCVYIYMYA